MDHSRLQLIFARLGTDRGVMHSPAGRARWTTRILQLGLAFKKAMHHRWTWAIKVCYRLTGLPSEMGQLVTLQRLSLIERHSLTSWHTDLWQLVALEKLRTTRSGSLGFV